MRLARLPPALAIIVLLFAALPATAATTASASATIVSPSAGDTILANATVKVHYAGYSPFAKNISGHLFLDGEWAGNFVALPVGNSSLNGTTVAARLHAENFTSGTHALSARVFTDVDEPVDTPAVGIVLDTAPRVSVSASYDVDARELVADLVVEDEGTAFVTLRSGPDETNATFVGARTMRLAADRWVGTYAGEVEAEDARGQRTSVAFTYEVLDRPATFSDIQATYRLGGRVDVRFSVSDPDGLEYVYATTELGDVYDEGITANTTWSGTLHVRVDPELGTWNGTVGSSDRYHGRSNASFTFTIAGEVVTIFQREVVTDVGSYQDVATIGMPALLDAAIEICIDTCDASNDTLPTGGEPEVGQFEPCRETEPPASANLAGWAVWYAGQAVDRGEVFRPERGPGPTTGNWPLPSVDTGLRPNVCERSRLTQNTTVPESLVVASVRRTLPPAPALNETCASTGGGARCAFESKTAWALDLAWAQAPQHRVIVRVTGVRI